MNDFFFLRYSLSFQFFTLAHLVFCVFLDLKKLLKPSPGSFDAKKSVADSSKSFASKDLLLELVPCRCSRFLLVHGSVKMKYS